MEFVKLQCRLHLDDIISVDRPVGIVKVSWPYYPPFRRNNCALNLIPPFRPPASRRCQLSRIFFAVVISSKVPWDS
jgi:hypothetical protein